MEIIDFIPCSAKFLRVLQRIRKIISMNSSKIAIHENLDSWNLALYSITQEFATPGNTQGRTLLSRISHIQNPANHSLSQLTNTCHHGNITEEIHQSNCISYRSLLKIIIILWSRPAIGEDIPQSQFVGLCEMNTLQSMEIRPTCNNISVYMCVHW